MFSQPEKQEPDLTRLPSFPCKPRIFILSDIENEPDDQESLVRYLLYCNEFDTRGICAVTSAWLPDRTAPETMLRLIEAYGLIRENLNKHVHPDARFPPKEQLRKLVSSGARVYGKQALALPLSQGARDLVDRLEESTRPLWVVSWGGTNVLAEALQHIRDTRSLDVEAALHSRLRVYTISDQDDTGEWIRNTFPEVFYICSVHGFGTFDMASWQGISHPNSGGDLSKVSAEWLQTHIQKGPLGALYPTPMHIMEGDTPTFLYLIQNGLSSPENPAFGSWGGRYKPVTIGCMHYADAVDSIVQANGTRRTDNKVTIARWRDHFQTDFACRMQWSLTPDFASATHPPVPIVNGHRGHDFIRQYVKSGNKVILDARESYDPDHPDDSSQLEFQWYQYLDPTLNHPIGSEAVPRCIMKPLTDGGETDIKMGLNECGFRYVTGSAIEVTIPDSKAPGFFNLPGQHWLPHTGLDGMYYHIILQVSQKGVQLPMRRYKRIILDAGTS